MEMIYVQAKRTWILDKDASTGLRIRGPYKGMENMRAAPGLSDSVWGRLASGAELWESSLQNGPTCKLWATPRSSILMYTNAQSKLTHVYM